MPLYIRSLALHTNQSIKMLLSRSLLSAATTTSSLPIVRQAFSLRGLCDNMAEKQKPLVALRYSTHISVDMILDGSHNLRSRTK